MTLPPLTPDVVRRMSPAGRLETHQAILSEIDGKLPAEIDLSQYRRCIEIARHNWTEDHLTARVFLEKADKELLNLRWLRSKEVEAGVKQIIRAKGPTEATGRVLACMVEVIASGRSASNAAKIAFDRGYGSSKSANLQAWNRYGKNL